MFEAESAWLAHLLSERRADELSPLLNLGSSTGEFREKEQPWTERDLFAPLRARGVKIVHLDAREGEGIDIHADVLNDADLPRIKAVGAKAILCCNILEHVVDQGILAERCVDIVGPGGFIFVTVPFSYPYHRDPIDTMYRPAPDELAQLFRKANLVHAEIVDVGESHRDQVKARPWILLRPILRFPFPFLGLLKWKRSMAKLHWLFHNYKITGAVFQVPRGNDTAELPSAVDSAGSGP